MKLHFFLINPEEYLVKQICILFQIHMTPPGLEMPCFNTKAWAGDDSMIKHFH